MAHVPTPHPVADEQALFEELMDPAIVNDPYRWIRCNYDWGNRRGEAPSLEGHKDLRTWQRDLCEGIADHFRSNVERLRRKHAGESINPKPFRHVMASGRGVGKSAIVTLLCDWMRSTRWGSTTIVAANTEAQLRTKTFAEMQFWHTLARNRHWFHFEGLKFEPAAWFKDYLINQLKISPGYYYCQGQLWSEHNPSAFAGAHNAPFGIMVVFDECSGIVKPIWTVAEGFFTETGFERYWLAFGNPWETGGMFQDVMEGKQRKRWKQKELSSLEVEGLDHDLFHELIEAHGIDSYEVRTHILGKFPLEGDDKFIARTKIERAQERQFDESPTYQVPLILGVDPAHEGRNKSVLWFRQGRNAQRFSWGPARIEVQGYTVPKLARFVADHINRFKPDHVCIDKGAGHGVIDLLREWGFKVYGIDMGIQPEHDPQFFDLRTELWSKMDAWMEEGCIDNEYETLVQLNAPKREFREEAERRGRGKVKLESKKKMWSRGVDSPDRADALSCTFYLTTPAGGTKGMSDRGKKGKAARGSGPTGYDPYDPHGSRKPRDKGRNKPAFYEEG